jgi:hypothetical protein
MIRKGFGEDAAKVDIRAKAQTDLHSKDMMAIVMMVQCLEILSPKRNLRSISIIILKSHFTTPERYKRR